MNKIINGKRYDTNTATLVYEAGNGYYNDCNAWGVDLYRKRTGEYFLHFWGGSYQEFLLAESSNTYNSDGVIKPITVDDAREWLEKNADADTYESEFGPVASDDNDRLNLSLPNNIKNKIKDLALQKKVSMNDIVIDAVLQYINNK